MMLAVLGCNRTDAPSGNDMAVAGQPAVVPIPSVSQPPGHQKMVKMLREINDRLIGENKFLGDEDVKELRKKVGAIHAGTDDASRCKLQFQLGESELRLGNEQDAITLLTAAHELLASPEVGESLGPEGEMAVSFQLGVAYMRLAETLNCCRRNTPDSCIFPIRERGSTRTGNHRSTRSDFFRKY